MNDYQIKQLEIMENFLKDLNRETASFVLKGGTALMLCYDLDRFSEDIDFDGTIEKIKPYVEKFCFKNKFDFNVKKDTSTTQRYTVHFNQNYKPLKIETSYRNKIIDNKVQCCINGILTYNIDYLCKLKILEFLGRNKIRDLYDLVFIGNNYAEDLTNNTKQLLQSAFFEKGFDYIDYLVKTQNDDLIDERKIYNDYLNLYDNLNLIRNDDFDEQCYEYFPHTRG